MKILNLFPILLICLMAACNPKEKITETSISGHVVNPKGENVAFRLQDTTISVALSQKGKFETKLPIEKAEKVVFAHGNEISTLYVRPGDQLSLSIDPQQFDESLQYTGEGSSINNFLVSIVLMEDSLPSIADLASFPEDSFLVKLRDNYSLKEKVLQESSVDDEKFKKWYLKNNDWEFFYNLSNYPSYRSRVLQEPFEASESFYAYQDTLNLNDSANLAYEYFIPYIQREITKRVGERFKDRGPRDVSEYIMASMEEVNAFASDPIKEKLLYEALNTHFNRFNKEDRARTISQWKALNPTKAQIAAIEDKLKVLESLAKGKPAPNFKYVNLQGDSMSMEDFKGKVVYIDVWATWCGPCIKEHPYMEELQKKYENENVEFLAISIDPSPEPWKKMVKEKELGGIHLYAKGEWEATIMKNYAISGIPRFILIDQEGKIVDANAERPSGNIAEDIKQLL